MELLSITGGHAEIRLFTADLHAFALAFRVVTVAGFDELGATYDERQRRHEYYQALNAVFEALAFGCMAGERTSNIPTLYEVRTHCMTQNEIPVEYSEEQAARERARPRKGGEPASN